jgi:hypothetical protein
VDLSSGALFSAYVQGIDPRYQYLGVQVFPFMKKEAIAPNQTSLVFDVVFSGKMTHAGGWTTLWQRQVQNDVECFDSDESCMPFYILDEPELEYNMYQIQVHIPIPGSDGGFLGDFLFQWQTTNPAFEQMQVAIRIILSIFSVSIAIWFTVRLMPRRKRGWAMEQGWGLSLIWCLLLLNNPFYPIQVYTASAFWPVIFSVFEAIFVSAFMLYCLLYLDMVRLEETRVYWKTVMPWLKVAAIFVYFVLSTALYMWEEVLFFNDPIVEPTSLTGPSALFYAVALVYAGLVCWVVVLLIFIAPRMLKYGFHNLQSDEPAAAPRVRNSEYVKVARAGEEEGAPAVVDPSIVEDPTDSESPDWHEVTTKGGASSSVRAESVEGNAGQRQRQAGTPPQLKYLHTVVPMILVAASTLISVLSGSIGPFGRTAPSFMYFHVLYNVVIYFWIFGYWPTGAGGVVRANNERRPLVENPFAAAEVNQSENESEPLF